jgi:hypothetical protein
MSILWKRDVPDWKKVALLPIDEQVGIFRAYLARYPRDHRIWFDLGLAHKRLRQWPESVEANLRAVDLAGEQGNPAWWNLGIAATALSDWPTARRAWRGYGIEIADGAGPIEANYGLNPVRLPSGEVVWGERIDPARLIVRNIPFPDSGYRWGDVVLHDGAPNGSRVHEGRTLPVFDVLERLSPSEIPTLKANVRCDSGRDSDALVELFEQRHFAAEDWTDNVRPICTACSEGEVGEHEHESTTAIERIFGFAAHPGFAQQLLEEWRAGAPDQRSYEPPEVCL